MSKNLILYPFIFILSSIISLVVPAIDDVIAFSSFKKQFNKVDLPTFGFPAITIGIPSLIAFPYLKDFINLLIFTSIFSKRIISFSLTANSTSSSLKSILNTGKL